MRRRSSLGATFFGVAPLRRQKAVMPLSGVIFHVAKRPKKQNTSPVIENRKARHDYAISDTIEVGMVLRGSEVKVLRDGKASLAEGYVRLEEGKRALWLIGVNIPEYAPSAGLGHLPTRKRKLLAHRREITKLAREVDQKGTTLVPLKLYFKDGYAKLLIGVARGKTHSDKRDVLRDKATRREIDRAMSKRM